MIGKIFIPTKVVFFMVVQTRSLEELSSCFQNLWPTTMNIPWQLQKNAPNAHYCHEMEVIARLCRLHNPRQVFEFGTYHGFTTFVMALNTPIETRICTLDLPIDQDVEQAHIDWDRYNLRFAAWRNHHCYFKNHPAADKIMRLYGDSLNFDAAPYAKSINLVLVDANHQLRYLQKDTENAFQMSALGGIILWHDYGSTWPDVTPFLNAISEEKEIIRIEGTNYALFRNCP